MAKEKEKNARGPKNEGQSDDGRRAEKDEAHAQGGDAGAPDPPPGTPISLPKLDICHLHLTLVGDSELICHHWSEKSRRQMLDKQTRKASEGKPPKDPAADYRESLYLIEPAGPGKPFENGKFGFPSIAFKNAAVAACTSLGKSVTKVQARQAFHVMGELIPITGKPRMREDMVRLNGTTADIRHRGGFPEWSVELFIRFNARVLSDEQVVNLFNTAGFAVGVGEWRSEKNGGFGLFHVS